ncbi:DUF4357 domain-containing protein [Clostridium sp. AM09-51]|jgi:hypothetical protein|nr:DUF4357 domain-containing protein [Clostridium sp. AM09-51]
MMEIYLKSKQGLYDAEAEYKDGIITVKKGSKIQLDFAEHIRGGKTAKKYREDKEYVNQAGVVVKDCEFTSASTAAQFVTGRSTNGLVAWKVKDKVSLKNFLASE